MKLFYKIIIFLAVFQISIFVINALAIFPENATLWSDAEIPSNLRNANDTMQFLRYMFVPDDNPYFSELSWAAILGVFTVAAAVSSLLTRSIAPAVMIILIYLFIPMITQSKVYIDKIFYMTDSTAVIYLGVIIFLGISIIALITIAETASHGRSG